MATGPRRYWFNYKCDFAGCPNKGQGKNVHLFDFPKKTSSKDPRIIRRNRERYRLWAEVCGISNPDLDRMPKKRICDEHFDYFMFKSDLRDCLFKLAYPSRNPVTFSPLDDTLNMSTIECHKTVDENVLIEPAISFPSFPSTSTPKPSCAHKLLSSSPEVINLPDSSSETLATPLDSSISLSASELADVMGNQTPVTTSRSKKLRRSLVLYKMNMSRLKELSPREKILFGCLKKGTRKLQRLKKRFHEKTLTLKELDDALSGEYDSIVRTLSKSMSLIPAHFLAAQVKHSKRAPKGRRWSESEKLIALTMFKRSPKSYALLRSMKFALPSKRTLISLLNKVPFNSGINKHIFNALGKSLSKYEKSDRICSLMFDEMAIREHLQYDFKTDRILGYEDLGPVVKRVANQALVFMVKGLHRKWQQPVAFYFSHGGVKANELSSIVQDVIKHCSEAGLNVVTTVCDMGASNCKALKDLGASFTNPVFTCNNQEVVTIYDPPHLLKCTRNMLLKHDVLLNVGSEQIASWIHITDAYTLDQERVYRMMPKVNDNHFKLSGKSKMKVKLAAQIFSQRTAAAIESLVYSDKMVPETMATASMVSFLNKLFDSLNGTSRLEDGPAGLRCKLDRRRENLHLDFWTEALVKVDGWKFLKKSSKEVASVHSPLIRPPSQNGWLATLKGVMMLWESLKKKGFTYLETRALNQDPIENLFGCIRTHCGSNYNPSIGQFQAALKTCIVNRMAFREVWGSNCEMEREPAEVLNDLRHFLSANPCSQDTQEPSPDDVEEITSACDFNFEVAESYSLAHVSGYIASRLLRDSNCSNCKAALTTSVVENFHFGIQSLEYRDDVKCLTYPSKELCEVVGVGTNAIECMLNKSAYKPAVKQRATDIMNRVANFQWLGETCADHTVPLQLGIVDQICKIGIFWWVKRQNRALRDKK